MWYKPYGTTGKEVSVISFGGMRFPNPQDIDASAELMLYAYNRGVNYFDTAPNYCQDKSEDITGRAIKQMKPGTFFVSTKCADSSGDKVTASIEKSLTRLGVPKIHFFHIWCVVTLDAWRERQAKGAVKAALKAKERGLVEHVVVSSHLPGNELAQMLDESPFEGVTLGYCAINFPYRQQAVDAAGAKRLGVVTMNPLGGGLIPQNADKFDFLRGPQDDSVVEAALRFNISQPAITSALVGFSSTRQIDEAVAAVDEFQPYDRGHIQQVRDKIMGSYSSLCTGCGYCLPCPKGIEVPKMMDAYNLKLLDGDKDQAISDRLKWHWGKQPQDAQACTLCGACESKCTQRLPIRERMQHIGKLAKK